MGVSSSFYSKLILNNNPYKLNKMLGENLGCLSPRMKYVYLLQHGFASATIAQTKHHTAQWLL